MARKFPKKFSWEIKMTIPGIKCLKQTLVPLLFWFDSGMMHQNLLLCYFSVLLKLWKIQFKYLMVDHLKTGGWGSWIWSVHQLKKRHLVLVIVLEKVSTANSNETDTPRPSLIPNSQDGIHISQCNVVTGTRKRKQRKF